MRKPRRTQKRITLEKVYACLKYETNEVTVPEEVAKHARKALEKMLKLK